MPFASETPPAASATIQPTLPYALPSKTPPSPPTLHFGNLRIKTRVETQSNARLTLDPVPPHVRKLHLQPYTLSKAKQVAKPAPEPSPDTYELYATVVCASAMYNTEKRQRALQRAAKPHLLTKQHGSLQSSADDADPPEEEVKPLDGGPVKICSGCIERDRKRANRKKSKNGDEEAEWEKNEDKRVLVFNTHEIKEWQHPSSAKNPASTPQDQSAQTEEDLQCSSSAMQIDLPTRIACYGRHHDEKIGFQYVIS